MKRQRTEYEKRFGDFPIDQNVERIAGLIVVQHGSQSADLTALQELSKELLVIAGEMRRRDA